MVGITAHGAYVPKYRLGPETAGWNSKLERAVANFDEDSVTMAVAAGIDCLRNRDRQSVDGLLFATTTPPYAEKQCAAIIAAALDLRHDIFTADITNVLRAGTTALKTGLDSVAAGSAGHQDDGVDLGHLGLDHGHVPARPTRFRVSARTMPMVMAMPINDEPP